MEYVVREYIERLVGTHLVGNVSTLSQLAICVSQFSLLVSPSSLSPNSLHSFQISYCVPTHDMFTYTTYVRLRRPPRVRRLRGRRGSAPTTPTEGGWSRLRGRELGGMRVDMILAAHRGVTQQSTKTKKFAHRVSWSSSAYRSAPDNRKLLAEGEDESHEIHNFSERSTNYHCGEGIESSSVFIQTTFIKRPRPLSFVSTHSYNSCSIDHLHREACCFNSVISPLSSPRYARPPRAPLLSR